MTDQSPEVGDHVVFTDDRGRDHDALVTAVHGGTPPSINVVIAHPDPEHDDPYGRQIKRETSIVHQDNQAAYGQYWRHPDT